MLNANAIENPREDQKYAIRILNAWADELEALGDGTLWLDANYGDTYVADEPKDEDDEQASIVDVLGDVYNVRFIVDGEREFEDVRLMVACGGPTIWLNTETENIELYWGCDEICLPMSCEAVDEIRAYGAELYNF